MLTDDFFNKLEQEIIPNALKEIANPDTKGFWCDGVIIPNDSDCTKKIVNDNRHVLLKTWVGKDGQTEYDLILHFGPQALSRYARDLSITDCIPDTNASEWFTMDVQQKKIELQLL